MEPSNWTIRLVNGELINRGDFDSTNVQLHIRDYGVMIRACFPTRETTYPWHAIAQLTTES
ncbi:hypothetical protein Srufu_079860 (plasmid) [Streptomyces libani subsp. rufus]|nr:hypothetical protein Srufu_079860 [Streptomyces libani subsp. rufus]